MSYNSNIAHMELDDIIARAIREEDPETIYKWADVIAETDEEVGMSLKKLARQIEDNAWVHDSNKGN